MKKMTKQAFIFVLLVAILSLVGLKVVYGTSGEKIAVPSQSSFVLDGIPVTPGGIFNIEGSNYANLRSIAQLLSGTKSQFNIYWDDVLGQTIIETGKPYTGLKAEQPIETEDMYMIGETIVLSSGVEVKVVDARIMGISYTAGDAVITSGVGTVFYKIELEIKNSDAVLDPNTITNNINFVSGIPSKISFAMGRPSEIAPYQTINKIYYTMIKDTKQANSIEIKDPQTGEIHKVFVNY